MVFCYAGVIFNFLFFLPSLSHLPPSLHSAWVYISTTTFEVVDLCYRNPTTAPNVALLHGLFMACCVNQSQVEVDRDKLRLRKP